MRLGRSEEVELEVQCLRTGPGNMRAPGMPHSKVQSYQQSVQRGVSSIAYVV